MSTIPDSSDRIRLTGLSARGHHGALPLERQEGQVFTVDVLMDLGERGSAVAAMTDDLNDAVDYSQVAIAVVEVIQGEAVSLIETLAARICEVVLGFPRVLGVEVTVHKPQAPLEVAFDDVSITVTRTHEDATALPPGRHATYEATPVVAQTAPVVPQPVPEVSVQVPAAPGAPWAPVGAGTPGMAPYEAAALSGPSVPSAPAAEEHLVADAPLDLPAADTASAGSAPAAEPPADTPGVSAPDEDDVTGAAGPAAEDLALAAGGMALAGGAAVAGSHHSGRHVGSWTEDDDSAQAYSAGTPGDTLVPPVTQAAEPDLEQVPPVDDEPGDEPAQAFAEPAGPPADQADPAEVEPAAAPDLPEPFFVEPLSADSGAQAEDLAPDDPAVPLGPAMDVSASDPVATPALGGPVMPLSASSGALEDEPGDDTSPATPAQAETAPVSPAQTVQDDAASPVPDPLDQRPERPVDVVIALGGNVGGVVPALRTAVKSIESTEGMELVEVAPLARTAAVTRPGADEQPDFLNTVVLCRTVLSPREVLEVCRGLEEEAGRVRTETWGPRTLDADVIVYEGVTSQDPELTLPHPAAAQRAFVLVPWAEADPFAELSGQAVSQLAEVAPDRDGVRWLALDWIDSDHLPTLPTGQYVAPPTPEPEPVAEEEGLVPVAEEPELHQTTPASSEQVAAAVEALGADGAEALAPGAVSEDPAPVEQSEPVSVPDPVEYGSQGSAEEPVIVSPFAEQAPVQAPVEAPADLEPASALTPDQGVSSAPEVEGAFGLTGVDDDGTPTFAADAAGRHRLPDEQAWAPSETPAPEDSEPSPEEPVTGWDGSTNEPWAAPLAWDEVIGQRPEGQES